MDRPSFYALKNWFGTAFFIISEKITNDCNTELVKITDGGKRQIAWIRLMSSPSKYKNIVMPADSDSESDSEEVSSKEKKKRKQFKEKIQGLRHSDLLKLKLNRTLLGWSISASALMSLFGYIITMEGYMVGPNSDYGFMVRAYESFRTCSEGQDKIFFGPKKNTPSFDVFSEDFRERIRRERNKNLMRALSG